MNNNFNLSDGQINGLLQMAAGKLGKDPAELRAQLEAGQLDSLMQSVDTKSADQINTYLKNPEMLNALLGNKNLLGMLGSLGKK